MVSKCASVNFNALIKILGNASKLDCQAAVFDRVEVLISRRLV